MEAQERSARTDRRRSKYRKRRLGAALLAVVGAGVLYAGTRADAGQPPAYHVVAPGETLWSIAIDHYPPSEDPRAAVKEIRRANGLEGSLIRPGTRLELPPA